VKRKKEIVRNESRSARKGLRRNPKTPKTEGEEEKNLKGYALQTPNRGWEGGGKNKKTQEGLGSPKQNITAKRKEGKKKRWKEKLVPFKEWM